MKKTLLIATLVLTVLAVFATSAFALGPADTATRAPRDGSGILHKYITEAFAAKLGISVDALTAARAEGKTMYDIALEAGIAEADIPTLWAEVRATALDAAVADGVITQEQADWMKERMQNGARMGNCDGTQSPDGKAFGPRGGGMMGGRGGRGGWGQTQP
jgi:hypothetical protein